MGSSQNVINIDELINKLKEKASEFKEIYDVLKSIRKLTGASFDLPDINSFFAANGTAENIDSTGNVQIKPDQFYKKSQTSATEEYLRMVGHAMHLDDIFNALKEGGVKFTGDGKKVLYSQVSRATKKFAKVKGEGLSATYGLEKWYKKRQVEEKASTQRPRIKKRTEEESLTQPEGQVQAASDASKNDDDTQDTTAHNPDDK